MVVFLYHHTIGWAAGRVELLDYLMIKLESLLPSTSEMLSIYLYPALSFHQKPGSTLLNLADVS